ncbi:MAG: class I SAM-dependent methyltransferase [Pyrinomonadaceae bacterium]
MDAVTRFSNRVDDYIKYRPRYPAGIIDFLSAECGLNPDAVIADVGSGTGILSELFLKHGNRVYGVEPNPEMREAGERILSGYSSFISVAGSAEATSLTAQSVDYITAAQAFHWFDRGRARAEFERILKPGGWVLLLWNERRTDSTAFLRDYEELLLTYGTDYNEVRHENVYENIAAFFAPQNFKLKSFENNQVFDYEGLKGRLLSSSYVPASGQPNFDEMLVALRRVFDIHQQDGRVVVEYDARVYYGQLVPRQQS